MSTYSRQQGSGCACAVQTTAPTEKGTTRWPLSSIPWHHPWWLAHLSRVAQVCTANQSASSCAPSCREETRQGMLPCLLKPQGLCSAPLPQGQPDYCAKFYFRQTFESNKARLVKVYSASQSRVQYFHNRIKSCW